MFKVQQIDNVVIKTLVLLRIMSGTNKKKEKTRKNNL